MFEPGSIGGVNRMCPLPNVPPPLPPLLLIRPPLAPTAPPLSTSLSLVRLPWQLCPLDLSTYRCLGQWTRSNGFESMFFQSCGLVKAVSLLCGGKQENYPITEVKSRETDMFTVKEGPLPNFRKICWCLRSNVSFFTAISSRFDVKLELLN